MRRFLASSGPGQTPPSTRDRNNAICAAFCGKAGADYAQPSLPGSQARNKPCATLDREDESGAYPPAHRRQDVPAHEGTCARFLPRKSPAGPDLPPPRHPARSPDQPLTSSGDSTAPLPSLPAQPILNPCRAIGRALSSPDPRQGVAPSSSVFACLPQ